MTKSTDSLTQFRQKVYQTFSKRAAAKMDLLDALCSQDTARSVVELSLTPAFQRHYAALFHAIADLALTNEQVQALAAPHLPALNQLPFWLLGVDVTPAPRPYARTLSDRQIIYQPTPVSSQKPISIGHRYSTVALLNSTEAAPSTWVVPLSVERVGSGQDKEMVGSQQIIDSLTNPQLPFSADELCVDVGDTSYSKPLYLVAGRQQKNRVTVVRARSNRIFYETPDATSRCWFGARFALRALDTWRPPDKVAQVEKTTYRGATHHVTIQAWHNMLMRGRRKPDYLPMHRHPFTLLRIVVTNSSGKWVFKRPLWLIVMGTRRAEVSLVDAYTAYLQRSKLEHFFRFGKQRLLLNCYQTAETDREEQWWRLVHLAYLQLWVARPIANNLPRPWERYLPSHSTSTVSPRMAQRDFGRLIRQLGTPSCRPKPRNRSSGRARGQGRRRRIRYGTVFRS